MRSKNKQSTAADGRRSIGSRSNAGLVMFFSMTILSTRRFAAAWVFQSSGIQRSIPSTHRMRTNFALSTRCFASSSDNHDEEEQRDSPKQRSKRSQTNRSKKFKIAESIDQSKIDKLAQAFDELARKEGFDSSTARFADDVTFEDKFDDDSFLDDDDDNNKDKVGNLHLDASMFSLGDFIDKNEEDGGNPTDQDDEDYLDFGADIDMSIEARIAAAKRDMDLGRVSAPPDMRSSRREVTAADLRKLGFRTEANPFGNDETPRKERFQLVTNSMSCSACGSDFQCHNEDRPGYLPPEKFATQTALGKIEQMQKLQDKAEKAEWTPEDEIEWLIQTQGKKDSNKEMQEVPQIDVDSLAGEMGLDLVELSKKKVICKRCHGLQNFGKVQDSLRPGWTKEPLLSQEKFRELLRPIKEKPAVIVALVDLFDFSGSVLPELDEIAGENPVILAANKADLLPSEMGRVRAESWVRRELEYLGVKSLAGMRGAVRLVSCKTGAGINDLLEKARGLAEEIDGDIYVVGAANAGKSTLLNFVLGQDKVNRSPGKARAGNRNAFKGAVTTSPLPGTTLKFIKVDLGGGRSLYDTPGLLVLGTVTQLLTPEELKIVVPKKPIEPVTLRLSTGKCVLVGGLARIELIGDSRPFMFTFFVANEIKLHPTDIERADEFVLKHAGGMLTPPLAPGPKRMEEIGECEDHIVDIQGAGWKEAAADISLTGLGWVAVTGAGTAQVKISVPKGIGVSVRPPLMPFDIWKVASKYTGSRAVRKSSKLANGKRRKGVGRN
jgi:ribosome biogenesis GTPase A